MGVKGGLLQKSKLCWFWLVNPKMKHILTTTCEFCGSTNIIKIRHYDEWATESKKVYTAKLLCWNCKAKAKVSQEWTGMTKAQIEKIKRQLGL